MRIIEDLARYLEMHSLGVYTGEHGRTIFTQWLPGDPPNVLALFERDYGNSSAENYDSLRVQVLTRDTNAQRAYDRAQEVYKTFQGLHNFRIVGSGRWVLKIQAINSVPALLGKDTGGRYEYTQSFEVECEGNRG